MRTSVVLATAQDAPSYTANVTGLYNGTAFSNVLELSHTEEPYGASAMIRLNNYNGAYDAKALKGSTITLGWGVGAVASTAAVLWAYAQDFVSAPGRDEFRVYAEGAWDRLARFTPGTGDENGVAYYFNSTDGTPAYANYSIKDIISFLGTAAGVTITSTSEDSYIDTFEPIYLMGSNADGRSAVRTLLSYTKCVLIPSGSGLTIKYPQSGDATDETYRSGTPHYFRNGAMRSVYAKPLKVVVSNESYSGSATATGWTSAMGYLSYVDDCEAGTSNADCDYIAAAILQRVGDEEDTGFIQGPMNCLQEVYDKVVVTDSRGNISSTGRVGIISRHFKAGGANSRAVYDMEISLGGLQKNPDGPISPLSQALIESPSNLISPTNTFPANVPKGYQEKVVDINFYAKDNNEIYWSAGTITFSDGSRWLTNARAIGSALALTGTVDNYIYASLGTATLQNTTDITLTNSERSILCAIARAGSSTAFNAYILAPFGHSILINRDVVVNNLVGELQLAAEAVTNAKLAVGAIYGAVVAAGSITHTHIGASAIETNNISASAVTAACMAASAIVAINIAASAVTSVAIAASAVTAEKITGGAITAGKIDALAVASSCIAASAITAAKIAAGAIGTDQLAAQSVTFAKMAGFPSQLMDGYLSSFDSWTTNPGVPDGWTLDGGSASSWALDTTDAQHGANCAQVTVNASNNQGIRWGLPIYADGNDIITVTVLLARSAGANANFYIGIKPYDKNGDSLDLQLRYIHHSELAVTGTFYTFSYSAQCPAGTYYVKPLIGVDTGSAAYWYVDDVQAMKSAIIIMHGTVGGTRTEITADHVAGYNGTVLQWEGKSSDGKLYGGAGAAIIDATGVTIKGEFLKFQDEAGAAKGHICGSTAYNDLLIVGNADVEINTTAKIILHALTGIDIHHLPTTDPGTADAVWRNGTVLCISTG